MKVASSNRNNPELVDYYQNQADIIGIFWEFHKERIQAGNIEFALVNDYEARTVVPFNPIRKIESWRRESNLNTHKIITDFSDSVKNTMQGSWQQFLEGLGVNHIKDMLESVEVPDEQKRFFDPYTRELAIKTDAQAEKLTQAFVGDNVSLSGVGNAGMGTGSVATVQLSALFGEQFKPGSAVILSKIKLSETKVARKEIGLPDWAENSAFEAPPGDYSLLDNSTLGLKRDRLRELGLGFTLGCPSSMRISSGAKEFLTSKGVTVGRKTMLEEFAAMMPERFNHYVGEWYSGLSPTERQTFVDPEQNRILSGEIRRTAMERPLGCPYGKER